MSDPFAGGLGRPEPRPEPVLDAATTIRTLGLVLGALVAVLGLFGIVVTDDLVTRITTSITLVVGAAAAVWAIVVPLRAALAVRAQVTPVESPRDVDGTALVRVDGKPLA